MIGIPDFLCEVLAHERLAASGKLRPAFKIFWRVEEITAHSAADSSILTHRLFMVIFIIGFVLFIDLRGFFTVILVVLHKFYARINFVNSAQADEECSIDCTELPLGVIIDIDCFDHNVSRDMLVEPPQVCWHWRPIELRYSAEKVDLKEVEGRDRNNIVKATVVDGLWYVLETWFIVEDTFEKTWRQIAIRFKVDEDQEGKEVVLAAIFKQVAIWNEVSWFSCLKFHHKPRPHKA